MLLDGKVCLVTGASRGIGAEIARTFAANGASVIVTGRSESVMVLASELVSKGHRVVCIQGDLKADGHVREISTTIKKEFGQLDVLVNNAGILSQSLLGMISLGTTREMFEVNVFAMMSMTQYAVRLMAKSEAPSIINIASIAGTQAIEGVSAYSASKASVVGFTRASAKELASKGIRVNAIAPGFIDTEMTRTLPEEWFQKRVEGIRLGKRIGKPHDIANCALFLASELSSYVTGQIIGVDGGMIV